MESWPSQRKLNAAVRKQQREGKPVRILVHKTRRSGFTVGSCSHVFRETMPFPGRKAFVVADKYDPAALEAFGYFKSFTNNYVPFGPTGSRISMPELRVIEADLKIKRGDEVILDIYSADRGEIRGGGRHWGLFDEVAFWRAAQLTLRSAMNMVPDLPDTGIFIQSTANGIGGDFYEMCQRAQDPALAEGFAFLFFGWLEDANNVRLFDRPDHSARFNSSLDEEEKVLHSFHGATLEQLNWRRWKIRTNLNGRVEDFHQEYPTTSEEAFLVSGRPVFDHKALMRMPIAQGTTGELELYDDGGPQKRLVYNVGEHGALTIWRKPEAGRRYIIGADPSKGKDVSGMQRGDDPDYSVGFVIDGDSGEQVALLRARIRPVAFAEYLALVGRWYHFAYLIPEANDAGFIDALVRTGYPLERVYQRQRDPTDRRPSRIEEIGFETTPLTRDWLVGAAEDAIRNQTVAIHSSVVLQECLRFVIKPNAKKEHQDGAHDDCVFGLALAEIGRRNLPRTTKKPAGELVGAGIRYYGKKGRNDEDE